MTEMSDNNTAFRVARFFSSSVRCIKYITPDIVRVHLATQLSDADMWRMYSALAYKGPVVLEVVPPGRTLKAEDYD